MKNYLHTKQVNKLKSRLLKLQEENSDLKIENQNLLRELNSISTENERLNDYILGREEDLKSEIAEAKELSNKYKELMKVLQTEKRIYKFRINRLVKEMKTK